MLLAYGYIFGTAAEAVLLNIAKVVKICIGIVINCKHNIVTNNFFLILFYLINIFIIV